MQILVYLYSQNISCDPAPHRTTRSTAEKVFRAGLAGRVGQNAIQLWVKKTWREVKRLVLGTDVDPTPQLLAPLTHYPAYNYPLPYSLLKQYARPRIA